MSILSFISGLFNPVSKIIDKIPTDEGKMALNNELAKIQAEVQSKMIEYDTKILELQGELFKSAATLAAVEANSESWFVRHYKPVIVLGLFILICLDTFGITTFRLPEVFITVFSTAFGVVNLLPAVGKFGGAIVDKVGGKKNE